ncbi:unnamed protein product, partial [Phaeothamnion confervicola]
GNGGSGGWTTSRHYAVPTTDVPLHALPGVAAWFGDLLRTRLQSLLAAQFGVAEAELATAGTSPAAAAAPAVALAGSTGAAMAAATAQVAKVAAVAAVVSAAGSRAAARATTAGSGAAIAAATGMAATATARNLARLRVHDAFVVKYAAANQRALPPHRDQSTYSLTVALNGTDAYRGGGTFFCGANAAVRPPLGHV